MTRPERDIDAIVVSYNSEHDLVALGRSAATASAFRRVLVVDNDSTDASVEAARSAGFDVLPRGVNDGFAAAANTGIAATDTDVVAVMNPDVLVPDRAALQRLAAHFDDPRVGLVAPALRLPDGSRQDSARTVPAPATLVLRRRFAQRRGQVDAASAGPVPWVVAAFVLLRRSALERIGGFDEGFFLYFEDVDLCVRLRETGYEVRYDPAIEFRHEHQAASRRSLLGKATRSHVRSAARFYRRNPRYLLGLEDLLPGDERSVEPGLTPGGPRPPAFISWDAHTARAEELARGIGGVSRRYALRRLAGRHWAPLRYVINGARTAAFLALGRPSALAVQNPPTPLAVLGFAYARLTGAPLVLDSHPASFGRKGSRWSIMVPVHRWVARRAALVMVTADELADEVRSWGGRATLVHEAPPDDLGGQLTADTDTAAAGAQRPQILFAGVFAPDEPVEEVVAAAAALPEVDVLVTGDPAKAPPGLIASAPENVRFLGFLSMRDFLGVMARCDAALVLTTEGTSVVRAGYEAVYAGRPLVVSDWPVLRSMFPYAIHVENTAEAITAGLRRAIQDLDALRAAAPAARALQDGRWAEQAAVVRQALGRA